MRWKPGKSWTILTGDALSLSVSETRIVLVGKTGAGKSSCANTILGRDIFRSSCGVSSVTKQCSKEMGEVGDRHVTVVDTPGLFDTCLLEEKVRREVAKCINMSAPGPHAIVVVVKVCPFTREEMKTIERIEDMFGKDAERYAMILFTCGDDLKGTIEESLEEANEDLKNILKRLGNRYHIFNNREMNNRTQVLELFEKIDDMITENQGKPYTNEEYQEVLVMLNDRDERLKAFFEDKQREKEATLEALYNGYVEALGELEERNRTLEREAGEKDRRIADLRQKLRKRDADLKETKRYYMHLLKNTRKLTEQIPKFENFDISIMSYPERLSLL